MSTCPPTQMYGILSLVVTVAGFFKHGTQPAATAQLTTITGLRHTVNLSLPRLTFASSSSFRFREICILSLVGTFLIPCMCNIDLAEQTQIGEVLTSLAATA